MLLLPLVLLLLPGSSGGSRAGRGGPAEKMAAAGGDGGTGLRLGVSLAELAEALGSSEQALRLILSIFLGG